MIEELVKRASVVSTNAEKPRGSPIASLKSSLSTRERRLLHRLDRTMWKQQVLSEATTGFVRGPRLGDC